MFFLRGNSVNVRILEDWVGIFDLMNPSDGFGMLFGGVDDLLFN